MPTVEDINPTPSGHCQPGCLRLSAYLRGRFNLGDSGCYNPNSRLQSGAPSYHVHGQAIDLTANWHDPAEQVRGNLVFQWAYEHADELNLQECIFGHRIVTSRRWNEGIRFYPPTDHENHCHIAVGQACSQDWQAPGITPAPVAPLTSEVAPAMLFYRGAFHYFWIDANGDLQHKWPEGAENMSAAYGRATHPNFGPQDFGRPIDFRTHPANADAIIGTTVASSGFLVEWIFLGQWKATPIAPHA